MATCRHDIHNLNYKEIIPVIYSWWSGWGPAPGCSAWRRPPGPGTSEPGRCTTLTTKILYTYGLTKFSFIYTVYYTVVHGTLFRMGKKGLVHFMYRHILYMQTFAIGESSARYNRTLRRHTSRTSCRARRTCSWGTSA